MKETTREVMGEERQHVLPSKPLSRAKQLGVRPPLRAIRRKCVDDCCAGSHKLANDCQITDCELWAYRLGRNYRSRDELETDRERCRALTDVPVGAEDEQG